jgi:hypothetical protein
MATWRLIPSTTSWCTHTGEDNNVLLPALEPINSGDLHVTHGGAEAVPEHVLKQPPLRFIRRYYTHSFPVRGVLFVQGLVQFHYIQSLEAVKNMIELDSWLVGYFVKLLSRQEKVYGRIIGRVRTDYRESMEGV